MTKVIRPGYNDLETKSRTLQEKADALCREPSQSALEATKDAFTTAVESWSKVEIFRFGPVNREHRYERLFFWPDPKGIGLRQVQRALSTKDETVTTADAIAAKSVALQGLPALEYLLYGKGADELARGYPEVGFRCLFAASVSANIARIATQVAEGWREEAEDSKRFLTPAANDPFTVRPKT